jgi:hypothetical protein
MISSNEIHPEEIIPPLILIVLSFRERVVGGGA